MMVTEIYGLWFHDLCYETCCILSLAFLHTIHTYSEEGYNVIKFMTKII